MTSAEVGAAPAAPPLPALIDQLGRASGDQGEAVTVLAAVADVAARVLYAIVDWASRPPRQWQPFENPEGPNWSAPDWPAHNPHSAETKV